MKLLKINNLLNELNFKINKQKEIESFLKYKTKDGLIRLDGKVYGINDEEKIEKSENWFKVADGVEHLLDYFKNKEKFTEIILPPLSEKNLELFKSIIKND